MVVLVDLYCRSQIKVIVEDGRGKTAEEIAIERPGADHDGLISLEMKSFKCISDHLSELDASIFCSHASMYIEPTCEPRAGEDLRHTANDRRLDPKFGNIDQRVPGADRVRKRARVRAGYPCQGLHLIFWRRGSRLAAVLSCPRVRTPNRIDSPFKPGCIVDRSIVEPQHESLQFFRSFSDAGIARNPPSKHRMGIHREHGADT